MICFLSHPYSNSPMQNIQNAARIAKIIYHKYPGITLFSPLANFSFLTQKEEDYDRLMHMCYIFLSQCNALISCGASRGCLLELEYAERNNIPILYWNNEKEMIVSKLLS